MLQVLLQLLLLAIGFVFLVKGADWFVDGAAKLASRFGISQMVIGLTIVAMGTSLPEASVSMTSAIKEVGGIAVGNILGSNVANILLILGLSSLFRHLPVGQRTMRYEMPFLIGVTVLLPLLGIFDHRISHLDGGILLLLMGVYLAYLFRSAHSKDTASEVQTGELAAQGDEKAPTPLWRMLCFILLGLVCIVVGSELAVDAAVKLAQMAGISERVIGLTIVALGTSLPELVTSVTASLKGETDIAVGNIVGSNIFNILFVGGLSAVITPMAYEQAFLFDSGAAVFAVLLFFVCLLPKKRLGRISGCLMLASYVTYILTLLTMG